MQLAHCIPMSWIARYRTFLASFLLSSGWANWGWEVACDEATGRCLRPSPTSAPEATAAALSAAILRQSRDGRAICKKTRGGRCGEVKGG